jgi:hypothetical protein
MALEAFGLEDGEDLLGEVNGSSVLSGGWQGGDEGDEGDEGGSEEGCFHEMED